MKEIYQDFRGGKAFRTDFRLGGAVDANKVTKFEPGGLRITLPAARPQHFPVEVCAKFSLFGDFDVTGTYELLSAIEPAKGYGVGVALIVANNDKRDKFVKVGRLLRPEKGSVYFSEFWTRKPPEDYQFASQPTEVRTGQLRMARVGAHLRCLVADEVGKDFTVVFAVPNFGTEEMTQLRFEVSDGNSSNNPVDARLVDLRVRMQTFPPDKGAGPAPLPPQPVNPVDNPMRAEAPSSGPGWLGAALASAFVFLLLLAGAVAWLVFLRQRNALAVSNSPATFMSLTCSVCGKKLKIKAMLAGKKVKCPQCGSIALAG